MKTPSAPARNAGTTTARKGPVSASTSTTRKGAGNSAAGATGTKKHRLTRPEIRERDAMKAAGTKTGTKTAVAKAGSKMVGHPNAKKKAGTTTGKSGTPPRTPGKSTGMGLKKTA